MALQSTDRTLIRAFEGGNYANAYQSEEFGDHEHGLLGYSDEYRAAFILGFFATYERHEVPRAHVVRYEHALASPVASRLRELGLLDRCFITRDDIEAVTGRQGANA